MSEGFVRNSKMARWSDKEDQVVIKSIESYSSNLDLAFTEASKQLMNRSKSSCSQRWYSSLKHGATVVALGTKQGVVSNSKVVQFDDNGDTKTRKDLLVTLFAGADPVESIENLLNLLTLEEQKVLFKRSMAKLL